MLGIASTWPPPPGLDDMGDPDLILVFRQYFAYTTCRIVDNIYTNIVPKCTGHHCAHRFFDGHLSYIPKLLFLLIDCLFKRIK